MPLKPNFNLKSCLFLSIILISGVLAAEPLSGKARKSISVDFPLSLKAQPNGDIELVWESLPYDSCEYVIERSLDLSSGFVAIGKVQGGKKRYTQFRFEDSDPAQGTVYYRVKRKMPNQKVEVSGVQYVTLFYTKPQQKKQDHPHLKMGFR